MSDFLIVLSYFIIWSIIMALPSYLFYKMPKALFNQKSFLFKERKCEMGGKLYEKYFFIKKWKRFLPDGAVVFKKGFRKKHLQTYSVKYLEEFIVESCRAEASHIPPIFLSLIFALYNSKNIVIIMFLFGLILNFPCMITQRYNRIRINHILNRLKKEI